MTRLAKPRWLLFSLGLPLLAGGASMAFFAARNVARSLAMRGWTEVPARIVSAELESSGGGENATTYRVRAAYEYQYQGRSYRGDRVSPYGGSDNIGSFQEDAAYELRWHQERGEPFRAFVNPVNPAEAILYRDIRYGLLAFTGLFVVLLGGGGALLMRAAFFQSARVRPRSRGPQ